MNKLDYQISLNRNVTCLSKYVFLLDMVDLNVIYPKKDRGPNDLFIRVIFLLNFLEALFVWLNGFVLWFSFFFFLQTCRTGDNNLSISSSLMLCAICYSS